MINICVSSPDLKPLVGSEGAAGMDLRIDRDLVLLPGEIATVGTGVSMEVPLQHVALVAPRSSCPGFKLVNTVGIIDSDYRGEIFAKIHNTTAEVLQFFRGDRILQLVVLPILSPEFKLVDTLSETKRGTDGFGSTGVK